MGCVGREGWRGGGSVCGVGKGGVGGGVGCVGRGGGGEVGGVCHRVKGV